jgi:hypothetical protein
MHSCVGYVIKEDGKEITIEDNKVFDAGVLNPVLLSFGALFVVIYSRAVFLNLYETAAQ